MKNDLKFEEALGRIDQLVQELEDGEIALDKMLEKYEEGSHLIRFCMEQLNRAEARIKKLTEEQGTGNFTTEPLDE
jgi:exodeoxyribonuclease VII small subunit